MFAGDGASIEDVPAPHALVRGPAFTDGLDTPILIPGVGWKQWRHCTVGDALQLAAALEAARERDPG